jgi:hypothetical protein
MIRETELSEATESIVQIEMLSKRKSLAEGLIQQEEPNFDEEDFMARRQQFQHRAS